MLLQYIETNDTVLVAVHCAQSAKVKKILQPMYSIVFPLFLICCIIMQMDVNSRDVQIADFLSS